MRHEAQHDWRAIAFYGAVSLVVLVAGGLTLWQFFERQSLRQAIAPEPLPRVTVLAPDDGSRYAAAWVSLLSTAGFNATLVTASHYAASSDGITAVCSAAPLPPAIQQQLRERLDQGRGLVLLGALGSPVAGVTAQRALLSGALRLAEASSPILARVTSGYELRAGASEAGVIDETPQMTVDARWKETAKAAAAHFVQGRARVVWFGFDPGALNDPKDASLAVVLRTAFRWADGQPVSDAAAGDVVGAKSFSPAARNEAREKRLVCSVERMRRRNMLAIRVANHGNVTIRNATVKVWVPAGTRSAAAAGSFLDRRDITVTADEPDGAVVISLPPLGARDERLFALRTR